MPSRERRPRSHRLQQKPRPSAPMSQRLRRARSCDSSDKRPARIQRIVSTAQPEPARRLRQLDTPKRPDAAAWAQGGVLLPARLRRSRPPTRRRSCARLYAHLDLPYEDRFLKYWEGERHSIGGNRMRRAPKPIQYRPSRAEKPADLLLYGAVGWAFNRRLTPPQRHGERGRIMYNG